MKMTITLLKAEPSLISEHCDCIVTKVEVPPETYNAFSPTAI